MAYSPTGSNNPESGLESITEDRVAGRLQFVRSHVQAASGDSGKARSALIEVGNLRFGLTGIDSRGVGLKPVGAPAVAAIEGQRQQTGFLVENVAFYVVKA